MWKQLSFPRQTCRRSGDDRITPYESVHFIDWKEKKKTGTEYRLYCLIGNSGEVSGLHKVPQPFGSSAFSSYFPPLTFIVNLIFWAVFHRLVSKSYFTINTSTPTAERKNLASQSSRKTGINPVVRMRQPGYSISKVRVIIRSTGVVPGYSMTTTRNLLFPPV